MIDTFDLTLKKRTQFAPDIYQLTFSLPQSQRLTFKAGQYMIFRIPQKPDGDVVRRLYSISTIAGTVDEFDIIMQYFNGGVASEHFTRLNEGDGVAAQGPAGVFALQENVRNRVFVATGTGITPIMSMLRTDLPKSEDRKSTLLWGLRQAEDIYFLDELFELKKNNPNFMFRICLSQDTPSGDEEHMLSGRVQTGMESIFEPSELTRNDYYVCGSVKAVEDIRAHLYLAGVPREQVHFERFV